MQDASKAKVPVPASYNAWSWGFTPGAEIWNGRLAMLGFLAATVIELSSGKGFLHFWGIL